MKEYKVSQTIWTTIKAKDEDEARFKHQQLLLEDNDSECWTEWDFEEIKDDKSEDLLKDGDVCIFCYGSGYNQDEDVICVKCEQTGYYKKEKK